MEELKPCPFCGCEDIEITENYVRPPFLNKKVPDSVYVGCISCGVGYTEMTKEEAVEAWNRRKN